MVEIEQALVDWHATHLRDRTGSALADPRVQVVVADVRDHLTASPAGYDVVCLDVDNGPDWTVTDENAGLYGDAGARSLRRGTRAGGVLAVWSAAPARATSSCSGSSSTTCRSSRSRRTSSVAHPTSIYLGQRPAGA